MMTKDLQALARRAVAVVPIERWPEFTPVWFERDGRAGKACLREYNGVMMIGWLGCRRFSECADILPLLDTPAGVGSLLAVVREAWPPCGIEGWGQHVEVHRDHRTLWLAVQPYHDQRGALRHYPLTRFSQSTEVEALVAALEMSTEQAP